jgi:hypothetical protein
VTVLRRLVVGFGRFWWDFFVGDTPEIFVAAVVLLGLTKLLTVLLPSAALWAVLPPLVVVTLVLSVARAQRNSRH